jgi:hypothetical protein
MRIIRRWALVASGLILALSAAAVALAPGAHAGGLQLGLVSTSGFLRDSNNGGSGSPVVQALNDIDGPAENVSVNPTGTGNNVKIAFTAHAGLCVGLNPNDLMNFQLVSCATGLGTVFREYTRNGGLVFDNQNADNRLGGEWDLTGFFTGGQLKIDVPNGGGFQRWQNCSGGCA